MIGYVTLGTSDLARAARFYDAVAKEMGYGRFMENDQFIAWGDAKSAGIGLAKDRAQVDRLHKLAMDAGMKDEGAPGDRGGGFYAAYFRDPDGNKLNAFVMG